MSDLCFPWRPNCDPKAPPAEESFQHIRHREAARALRRRHLAETRHRFAAEQIHAGNEVRKELGWDKVGVPVGPSWKIRDQSTPHTRRPHTTHRNPEVSPPNWEPPWASVPRPARSVHYWLRDKLRKLSRDRIKCCGFALRHGGENVPVVMSAEGRCRFGNLQHCTSVWECPGCMLSIKAGRAEEVTKVVEAHGRDRCVMLTLTVRHGWGDNLELLRRDLADAWSGFIRGRPWERLQRELGVEGFVRALEVTHGENGWHPHLHILLLLSEPIPQGELADDNGHAEWMPKIRVRILERWRTKVKKHCGAQHEPDALHGMSLVPVHRSSYLAKLGLELTDVGAHKRGKNGSRTPLEIAYDWATSPNKRDAFLWQGYCRAMKGARQLTWSRGLKRKHGIRDRSDIELAECEDPGPGDRIIGAIGADVWRQIRVLEVAHEGGRMSAAAYILDRAERAGPRGLRDACLQVLCGNATTMPEPNLDADRRAYEKWVAGLVRPQVV